jgi:hypothetical protein
MSCAQPVVSGCPKAEACPPAVAEHADVPSGTIFGGHFGGEREGVLPCIAGGESTPGGWACGPKFAAASPDLSHVVVSAEAALTPGSGGGLYEWSAGKLAYVGRGGTDDEAYSVGSLSQPERNPVSSDGSRIVFTGSYEGVAGLLMHDMSNGQAVKLDAVQGGSGEGEANPEFQGASSDGSRVFFTDEQRLTADSGAEPGKPDLYECEMAEAADRLSCRLSDLTPPSSGEAADVVGGVLGIAEDGSSVYFAADGALAGGATHGECAAEARDETGAECSLYVERFAGSGWQAPKLIARLSDQDYNDWEPFELEDEPTRVSPNGEWLAFMSLAPLAGYDNHDALSGQQDAEVYLYDAASGDLACASCQPTGERPTGTEAQQLGTVNDDDYYNSSVLVAGELPGWQDPDNGTNYGELYQSRYLSDDGRLFFGSGDALVPKDVNGEQDVYEYEPQGVGSCTSGASSGSVVFKPSRRYVAQGRSGEEGAGCVGLISSGNSTEVSSFLDASESGGEVFFLSTAQLVPQDLETSFSLYDARECTAQLPCVSALAAPPACDTEASCRPSPSPQPNVYGLPASATFSGPGDVVPAAPVAAAPPKQAAKRAVRCGRGLVRKRGRCVRVSAKHRQSARARNDGKRRNGR